jgi:lipopolysaccharide/colanic/teichoic acid biosynthesis glycosyltransferase
MLIRLFDFLFALFGLTLLSPVILVMIIGGYFDTGSPLFFQKRIGRYKQSFDMLKIRTMLRDSPQLPTHLIDPSEITSFGRFLRKAKLDELPQLWNVLLGDMSLVGPRPSLPCQTEVISEREKRNVLAVKPGITGLSQINGIDMSTPELLAETDAQMLQNLTLANYFKYIFMTVAGKGSGDRVK